MNFIIKLNLRIISAVIIFALPTLIVPGILPAADVNYGLFAALRSEPLLMDITSRDTLFFEPEPLRGRFLVATRRLEGSFFSKTVIFLLNHSDQGSSGVVINRPSHINLSTAFSDVNELQNNNDTVYTGGPVGLNGFLILIQSDGKPQGSQSLTGNLHVGTSIETLKYIYNQSGTDEQVRVFFGYAGWRPSQLMSEVENGSWHVMTGDTGLIFDNNSDGLWDKFMQMKAHESKKQKEQPIK
jgi:putative transcriptional regulator